MTITKWESIGTSDHASLTLTPARAGHDVRREFPRCGRKEYRIYLGRRPSVAPLWCSAPVYPLTPVAHRDACLSIQPLRQHVCCSSSAVTSPLESEISVTETHTAIMRARAATLSPALLLGVRWVVLFGAVRIAVTRWQPDTLRDVLVVSSLDLSEAHNPALRLRSTPRPGSQCATGARLSSPLSSARAEGLSCFFHPSVVFPYSLLSWPGSSTW